MEKGKRALSSTMQTKLEIEGILDGTDFAETLTRAKPDPPPPPTGELLW